MENKQQIIEKVLELFKGLSYAEVKDLLYELREQSEKRALI